MIWLLPYSPWLVWIVPSVASLFVPVISKFGRKATNYFVISVSILTVVFAASIVPDVYFEKIQVPTDITTSWIPMLGIRAGVLVDPLSILFANLIAFLGFIVLVYSLDYMKHEEGLTRYYFLMLLFIGSMIGLVMADNFIQMYIFWEIVGLCSYALVSFWYKRPEAVKAGIKVFLMTRVGDVSLLVAVLILYINLGTVSFMDVFAQAGTMAFPMLTAVSFLTLIGAVAKSAQFPLHTWLYSAMEAPTSVSCLLHGATMVKGGVYLIARTHTMFSGIPIWLASVAWIGALTAFLGATLALHTPDIKGVPAYSTVSQIGFMFTAIGISPSAQSLGYFAGLFHLLSHAFFQGLGFLTVGIIIHQLHTRDMRKMGGLRRDMPLVFALSLIVIFTRSGVPPFASFFSKGLIASSIWSTGNLPLIFLIYAATAVTFAYSLRFLIITFLGKKSDYVGKIHIREGPALMLVSSGVLAVLCVFWGFMEGYLIGFMHVNLTFDVSRLFSLESLLFLLVLFVGGLPTYFVYYRKSFSPEIFRRGSWKFVDNLLEKDYYIDVIYKKIFVNGLIRIGWGLFRRFEVNSFDKLNYIIADSTIFVYKRVRKIQTGILSHNMIYVLLGLIVLLILMLLFL